MLHGAVQRKNDETDLTSCLCSLTLMKWHRFACNIDFCHVDVSQDLTISRHSRPYPLCLFIVRSCLTSRLQKSEWIVPGYTILNGKRVNIGKLYDSLWPFLYNGVKWLLGFAFQRVLESIANSTLFLNTVSSN